MIRWSFFLTKESDKDFVKKDLSKRIDLNYVSFVECDYSYAELMDLDKWLFDFFTKNKNKSFLNTLHVDGWNINKNKNKIIIKLNDCSSFYINGFKNKVIDTPMIGFEKNEGFFIFLFCYISLLVMLCVHLLRSVTYC